MRKVVYFDLDGVLADWVPAFEEASGIMIGEFNEYDKDARDEVKKRIVCGEFFENLKPIERGIEMFKLFKRMGNVHVAILSAHGSHDVEAVANAKRAWVEKHLGNDVPVWLVPKIKDKAMFAAYGDVLIDDRKKAIDAWEAAGGIGFHFV